MSNWMHICLDLHPTSHTLCILHAAQFPGGIEKNHDQLTARDLGLHHQATSCLRDVTRLLQTDIPSGVFDQAVRVL